MAFTLNIETYTLNNSLVFINLWTKYRNYGLRKKIYLYLSIALIFLGCKSEVDFDGSGKVLKKMGNDTVSDVIDKIKKEESINDDELEILFKNIDFNYMAKRIIETKSISKNFDIVINDKLPHKIIDKTYTINDVKNKLTKYLNAYGEANEWPLELIQSTIEESTNKVKKNVEKLKNKKNTKKP